MKLEHYDSKPIVLDGRSYAQPRLSPYAKPSGFWISVAGDYDWPAWCRSEEFGLDGLTHRHAVSIAEGANLLWLRTPHDMQALEDTFGSSDGDRTYPLMQIDWRSVARCYDGVMIPTYQWSERLSRMWYYGWDCASGCVWNTAVLSVELLDVTDSLQLALAMGGESV